MIKATLITLAALGSFGTSAMTVDAVKPAGLEISAGTVMFSFDKDGITTEIAQKSDYALRIKTKKGRVIAIRF